MYDLTPSLLYSLGVWLNLTMGSVTCSHQQMIIQLIMPNGTHWYIFIYIWTPEIRTHYGIGLFLHSYIHRVSILLVYTSYFFQDFPSIGQIAEKLDEFDIIPILAVVQGFRDLYEVWKNITALIVGNGL